MQSAYNALPADYKVLIAIQAVKKLGEAETIVATDKAAAQQVITKISGLTNHSTASLVNETRAAYNALTANQKQLVTNSNHLTAIESVQDNTGNSGSSNGGSVSPSPSSSPRARFNC